MNTHSEGINLFVTESSFDNISSSMLYIVIYVIFIFIFTGGWK